MLDGRPRPSLETCSKATSTASPGRSPDRSCYGSDFNYDFHATVDESVTPVFVNYRTAAELEEADISPDMKGEIPGYSVFLRDGERAFHTYSTYARGVELLNSSTQFIDLTPLGRQEG